MIFSASRARWKSITFNFRHAEQALYQAVASHHHDCCWRGLPARAEPLWQQLPPVPGGLSLPAGAAASSARGGCCKVRASSVGPSEARGRLRGGMWDRSGVVARPPRCWGDPALASGCGREEGLIWLPSCPGFVRMLFRAWVQGDAAHGLCRMPWCQPCRATGSAPLFHFILPASQTRAPTPLHLLHMSQEAEAFGPAAEGKAASGVIPPSSSWLPRTFPAPQPRAPRRVLRAAAGLSARRVGALVCGPGAERAGKPPARRTQARGCR